MASVTKKLGQFRQWTGEKIGNAQRTETSEDFKRLEAETNDRNNHTIAVHEALSAYIKSLLGKRKDPDDRNHKTHLENVGATMEEFGRKLADESNYGAALTKVGQSLSEMAEVEMNMVCWLFWHRESRSIYKPGQVSSVNITYMLSLNGTLAEMKEYQAARKKLENRRLDFDAKLNKVQKAKKDTPALEEDTRVAQGKYEDSLSDTTNKMIRLNSNEEEQLDELLRMVDAQYEYYRQCWEIVKDLKENLGGAPRSAPARASTTTSKRAVPPAPVRTNSYAHSVDEEDTPTSARMRKSSVHDRKMSYASQSGSMVYPVQGPNGSLQAPSAPRNSSYSAPSSVTLSTSSVTGAPIIKQAKVLFDFDADGPDELSIRKGDIINVTNEIDQGWWEGELADDSGRGGMFPANYVEALSKPAPPAMPSRPPPEQDAARSRHPSMASVTSSSSRHITPHGPPMMSAAQRSVSASGRSISASGSPVLPTRTSVASVSSSIQCSTCGCDDFVPHLFKQGQCNNCY
ncbi:hypothetical protein BJ742DRAFT_855673, partial [Cladochytrium replicatum]